MTERVVSRSRHKQGKLATMLLSIFLVGCTVPASPVVGTVETAEGTSPTPDPIEAIAAEFRGLRAIKGHFEGGDWNDDVDKWNGRKHQLMIQIGARLGAGEHDRSEVIQLLDPPDLIAREGDEFFDLVAGQPEFQAPATGTCELLIYYWRGTHDILYFAAQGEVIVSSGWWYAGD